MFLVNECVEIDSSKCIFLCCDELCQLLLSDCFKIEICKEVILFCYDELEESLVLLGEDSSVVCLDFFYEREGFFRRLFIVLQKDKNGFCEGVIDEYLFFNNSFLYDSFSFKLIECLFFFKSGRNFSFGYSFFFIGIENINGLLEVFEDLNVFCYYDLFEKVLDSFNVGEYDMF